MKPADVFLAVLVAVIWGLGFVATRLALDELSPALMTVLRFAIAAVPCLFVRRPNVSWTVLIAIGNLLLRRAKGAPMFDLFAWLCLVAAIPLLALAVVTDGPQATAQALWHMSPTGVTSMLFLGAISTCVAYWLWGRLLRDYTAAQVVPFALLVPFVGAGASSIVFGERFGPLRLSGMVIVVCGIAIMLLAKRPQ